MAAGLAFENVSKSFGKTHAVSSLSFSFAPGEIIGLLGPNGAGKTTSLRLMAGVLQPSTGTTQTQGTLSYLPESARLYPELRVIDFLHFVANLRGIAKAQQQERLQFVIAACELQDVLAKKCGELSKGFKQRTGLAAALLPDPDVLLLDEPTEGLDPHQTLHIRELLLSLKPNKCIVFSSHILSEVPKICDRVVILHEGQKIWDGPTSEIKGSLEQKFLELTK